MTALDTNILIYACDKADPKRQATALELISTTTDCVIPWQVACEFIAASRKLERQGFTATDAWDRLGDFLAVCRLVIPTGSAILDRAKNLHITRNVAFWDAMILASCLEAGIKILYSEDLPGGEVQGLSVLNPFM